MAITAAERHEIAEIFVLMFDAAPGATYLAQLISAYQSLPGTPKQKLDKLTDLLSVHPGYTAVHTVIDTNEEWTADLLSTVSLENDPQAKAAVLNALNDGMSKGDITFAVYQFLNGVLATPNASTIYGPQYINAANILDNKADVAIYFSVDAKEGTTNGAELQGALLGVDATDASVNAAKAAIDGDLGAQVITLTSDLDVLSGTGSADTFVGRVVQNSLGAQVNQLGSGDQIDGGAGMDMLTAKVTAGSFIGGSFTMPIQPETNSVEVIKIEAVNSDIDGYYNFGEDSSSNTQVYINAKDTVGVEQLWSNRSDADLVIQNLTTNGVNQLSDMTIGMAYTGNADSLWNESNYTVYFDQDYLTPEATRTSPVVDFLAMNEDNYDATDGAKPLDGVFFRQLQFRVNGQLFDLVPFLFEDKSVGGTGSEITTYAEFLAAVQNGLELLKDSTPANMANAALQSVMANFGPVFTTDANPDTLELREGIAVRLSVAGLIDGVANTIDVQSTDLEVARALAAVVPNNNRYELASNTPPETGEVLAINVALEKVGLAGDGGELIIGSMNKTSDNEWDAVNTVTDTTSGIEQFDVIVYGAEDKSSSLSGLHSTNNNLRVVTVTTDTAITGTGEKAFADLIIGNSNTDSSWNGPNFSGFYDGLDEVDAFSSYGEDDSDFDADDGAASNVNDTFYDYFNYEEALKDVQVFNASAFKGDLTLYAGLTEEVVAKYLDLQDDAPDAPAADNVAFVYTGGTGDDEFHVTLHASNLAAEGNTTREDFSLDINGGAGDDEITLAIIDSEENGGGEDDIDEQGLAYGNLNSFGEQSFGEDEFANWYDNNKLNDNLSIAGGAGDDTIRKPGSGDVIIDGDEGNDTVYADNTGDMAVWAFNVAPGLSSRERLDNLESDANDSYRLFDTDVVVNFKGFEVNAAITSTRGIATDLDINQAIKKAINTDPVLSKLLVAKDGPANTLVVYSLIDGDMDLGRNADLTISLEGPTAAELTAGEVNQLISFYGSSTTGFTAADFVGFFADEIDAFESNRDYASKFARDDDSYRIDGDESLHVSDNHITGGLGNDVIVLGTGEDSNDTVAWEGFGNGVDSIVYFDTTYFDANVPYFNSTSYEQVTLTFTDSDGSPAAQTIVFDGDTVNLAAPTMMGVIPAIDVASQFADQFSGTEYRVIANSGTTVTLERRIPGNDPTNVTSADFTGSYVAPIATGGGGTITPVVTDGLDNFVNGSASTFTITYTTATTAVTLAGEPGITNPVSADVGDGALSLYNEVIAVPPAGYFVSDSSVAADGSSYSVTFTASGPNGPTALPLEASFGLGATPNDGVNGSFTGTVGVADTTTPPILIVPTDGFVGEGIDYLDFSAYDPTGVYVDGVLLAGSGTTALNQTYIRMVETSEDGVYTITQMKDAGVVGLTGDTVVNVIGTADFGMTMDFIEENFII